MGLRIITLFRFTVSCILFFFKAKQRTFKRPSCHKQHSSTMLLESEGSAFIFNSAFIMVIFKHLLCMCGVCKCCWYHGTYATLFCKWQHCSANGKHGLVMLVLSLWQSRHLWRSYRGRDKSSLCGTIRFVLLRRTIQHVCWVRSRERPCLQNRRRPRKREVVK